MPALNTCCCLELETGGKIIAWIHIIISILWISINTVVTFGFMEAVPCYYYQRFLFENSCESTKLLSIGAFFIALIPPVIFFVTYGFVIRGIKIRQHNYMLPALITHGLLTAAYIVFQICRLNTEGLFGIIVLGSLFTFMFVIMLSIYTKMRELNRRGQYRAEVEHFKA